MSCRAQVLKQPEGGKVNSPIGSTPQGSMSLRRTRSLVFSRQKDIVITVLCIFRLLLCLLIIRTILTIPCLLTLPSTLTLHLTRPFVRPVNFCVADPDLKLSSWKQIRIRPISKNIEIYFINFLEHLTTT